jgi:hypothetical protein
MSRRRLALVAVLAVLLGGGVWLGLDRFGGERTQHEKHGSTSEERTEPAPAPRSRRTTQPRDDTGTQRLEGQVIDAIGQPVGGVSVSLDTEPPRVTQTEADGSFAFEGLAERTYRVGASKDDHRAQVVSVRVGPDVEPITLRLRRGNAMLVKVQDERGRPIVGARVVSRGLLVRDQRTGADGTTLLRGLGPAGERVEIEITADGYAPGFIGSLLPRMSEVTIERVATLHAGTSVRGVVRDPDGAPVAGARVSIRNSELHVTSGADGSWVIPAVRHGTQIFVARADGFAAGWTSRKLEGKERRDGVDITLQEGLTIAGRVVDGTGAPVSGAKISVATHDDILNTWADDNGEFKLTGLGDGVHELAAFHGDRASEAYDVDAGESSTEVELVVIESTIRGVVVNDNGDPVPDADIRAVRDDIGALTGEHGAVTDSAGRFVLGPLVVGGYEVRASYGGDGHHLRGPKTSARIGQDDVRVVLPRRASIRGRLTKGGVAVSAFAVSFEDEYPAYSDASVFARADGSFEIEDVLPGEHDLAFAGDSFARHVVSEVRVDAGEVVDLGAIEVGDGRRLRGRVFDGDGSPVAGATVQIGPRLQLEVGASPFAGLPFASELAAVSSAKTDAHGGFEVARVVDRHRWDEVVARADHPVGGFSKTVVIPTMDVPMELTLAGAGTIRGTIRGLRADDDGTAFIAPVGGYGGVVAELDEAGHFQVKQLAPGTYRVMTARSFPITTVHATAEVRSGETTIVELSFEGHDVTLAVDVGDRACRFLSVRTAKGPSRRHRHFFAMTKCDGDGRVRIPGLTAASYDLCVDSVCKPITITESPRIQTFEWR